MCILVVKSIRHAFSGCWEVQRGLQRFAMRMLNLGPKGVVEGFMLAHTLEYNGSMCQHAYVRTTLLVMLHFQINREKNMKNANALASHQFYFQLTEKCWLTSQNFRSMSMVALLQAHISYSVLVIFLITSKFFPLNGENCLFFFIPNCFKSFPFKCPQTVTNCRSSVRRTA